MNPRSRRFLFVSAPLPGHMDWGGMHRTALALRARGHEVVWASEETARPWLERWNLPFLSLPTTGWRWPHQDVGGNAATEPHQARALRAVAVWLTPEEVLPATEALVACIRSWQPDAIVTEPFIAAAAFAAELAHVPLVVAGWPAISFTGEVPPHQREAAHQAQTWFEEIRARLGCQGRFWVKGERPWIRSPWLHLAYFTAEWYAAWHVLVPPTAFVGGIPAQPLESAPSWLNDLPPTKPTVFVTLGTTFVEDELFFRRVTEAALKEGSHVIVAAGKPSFAQHLRRVLPDPVTVTPWVDYHHVFPRVQLVVHHGGMGTTHAALVYGVPQLVIPHAADQYYQAARVQRTGVGLALTPQQAQPHILRDAIQTLLWDRHWRVHATRMAQAMHKLGGAPRAAELLERLPPFEEKEPV